MTRRVFAINLKPTNIRSNANPSCVHCGQPATKEALIKESGCIVVEKYCDACIMDPLKFREILRLQAWAAAART